MFNRTDYNRTYMRTRYNSDPEFRARMKQHQKKWRTSPEGKEKVRQWQKIHLFPKLRERYRTDPEYRAKLNASRRSCKERHKDAYNDTKRLKHAHERAALGLPYRPRNVIRNCLVCSGNGYVLKKCSLFERIRFMAATKCMNCVVCNGTGKVLK